MKCPLPRLKSLDGDHLDAALHSAVFVPVFRS